MNKGLLLVTVFALCGFSAPVQAQYTPVEITPTAAPRPPLLNAPEDGTAWTVHYRSAGDLQPAAVTTSSVGSVNTIGTPTAGSLTMASSTCRKLGGNMMEEIVFANGSRTTRYFVQKYAISYDAAGELAVDSLSEEDVDSPDAFNEFSWISPETFAGETVYADTACLVYRQTRPGAEGKPTVVRSAFIAKDSRLPVGIEDGMGMRRYRFQKNRDPIMLPPEISAAIGQPDPVVQKTKAKYNVPQ